MIFRVLISAFFSIMLWVSHAHAATTFAAGSTVNVPDRMATFDSLVVNGIDLSGYTEGTLSIATAGLSHQFAFPFQPNDSRTTGFHYVNAGNNSFVTITGTDGATFSAVDFLVGDGWTPPNTNIRWEAYLDGVLTGSGTELGITGGVVVGWADISGFDTLLVAADTGALPGFGNRQAIAIDDLRAQVVPIPAALPLIASGLSLLGLLAWRRRRRQVAMASRN